MKHAKRFLPLVPWLFFAFVALNGFVRARQNPGPRVVVWVSPLDTNTTIEATMTNGIVIHAPQEMRVFLRTKYGSTWREVTLPVRVERGQHIRVTVPTPKAP